MKEHRGAVNSTIRSDDAECVSSSRWIVPWLNISLNRSQAMFATTMFRQIVYYPDESQYLSCGSDRKLTYWDSYDSSAIRVLDGSEAEINSVDIDKTGEKFVCAGNDYQVKFSTTSSGNSSTSARASGYINAVKISPDQARCVCGVRGRNFCVEVSLTSKPRARLCI